MKGIIYKATNLYNGLVYIGQTRTSLESRIKRHFADAKRDADVNYFHQALAQYGESGFEWNVLDEFEGTKEEIIHALNVAEEYHILKGRTMLDGKGYNATQGGYSSSVFAEAIKRRMKSGRRYRPMLQYDLDGNFIREFESVSEIGREYNKASSIGQRIGLSWNGFQWREKLSDDFPLKIPSYRGEEPTNAIIAYGLDGKFYKEFASALECSRELGKTYKIRDSFADTLLLSRSKDQYLVFKKKSNSYPMAITIRHESVKDKASSRLDTPVLQYNKKGRFMREFPSILAARRATGVSESTIRKWCEMLPPYRINHVKTKWVWRYKGDIIEDRIDITGKGIKVILQHSVVQMNKDGEVIKVWKNISQAATETGESEYLIKRQCLGLPTTKQTQSVWKYYRDNMAV